MACGVDEHGQACQRARGVVLLPDVVGSERPEIRGDCALKIRVFAREREAERGVLGGCDGRGALWMGGWCRARLVRRRRRSPTARPRRAQCTRPDAGRFEVEKTSPGRRACPIPPFACQHGRTPARAGEDRARGEGWGVHPARFEAYSYRIHARGARGPRRSHHRASRV